jgi:predicted DNA-binding transcriptional regulator AlpA
MAVGGRSRAYRLLSCHSFPKACRRGPEQGSFSSVGVREPILRWLGQKVAEITGTVLRRQKAVGGIGQVKQNPES